MLPAEIESFSFSDDVLDTDFLDIKWICANGRINTSSFFH
jgi:hypothetical protein